MNPIANHASFVPFNYRTFGGGRSIQAEQTRAGSIAQRHNMDLAITTAEGDTVTLSLSSALEADAGIHRRVFYEDGGSRSTQTAFFDFSRSRSLSIEIDGDLNLDEVEDIREAVAAIGGMIDDFLSGEFQEMAADGELLKELDNITSLNAAFSYERQVMYAQEEKVEISNTAYQGTRHGRSRGHGRLQQIINRIDRLTDNMADRVRGFGGRRDRLARSVVDLLGRYRSGETENGSADQLGPVVVQTAQSMFAQKIDLLTESASVNLTYSA